LLPAFGAALSAGPATPSACRHPHSSILTNFRPPHQTGGVRLQWGLMPPNLGSHSPQFSHAADVVVTGTGSGIGRAFAVAHARRGGRGVNTGRAQAVSVISSAGDTALAVVCDVSEEEPIRRLSNLSDDVASTASSGIAPLMGAYNVRTASVPACRRRWHAECTGGGDSRMPPS
jgi:hypothetical protein